MKWRFSRRLPGDNMTQTRIIVSHDRFKVGDEYPWLAERDEDGAVVTFTGKVRNHNLGDSVKALTLEHYPGMTEKSLAEIVEQARERWPLGRVTVIHRIGEMWPARRSGSGRRRRKASAGSMREIATVKRQNAGSVVRLEDKFR